jgi:polyisoprenoid-binding protein YceI
MIVSARAVLFGICIALLNSCAQPIKQAPVAPPAPITAAFPADLQGAQLYRLAPERSTLHILVYRGGTMANLGHNHVISSSTLSGYVWLHDDLRRSGFNIALPVNDMIVDDAQARKDEGADFVSVVNDSARAGTRANMLKPEQLDGEHYPVIRLGSLDITGARAQPQVHVQITIKNKTSDLIVPVQLAAGEESLRVMGQFQTKQSDFGIQPYSVAMGALQVQDPLTVKFELVALPALK